ncbi:flagellar hook assembly protein [Kordiimonas sediminis]|uniref:Basal-body rod modification protein FlgD n=1 Tax=Kordiimonas sediminis TaxID=1735581 RepID=A0A919AT12_9PROT|nr:flagellar hook assembly protein FlgD [Kordiimonas sediminis]GHF22638.1 flagellar hook assembly protein [Kordiimonas sediminis]
MDISGITSAGQSKAGNSAQTLAGNFDTFLTLLTSQLQNQDPMDPMKSNEFTQQLVQFAGVEQQIQQNQNLESISKLLAQQHVTNVSNYLGHKAVIPADRIETDGKGGTWEYDLPLAADDVKLEILDSDGNVVYEGFGSGKYGTNTFNWDGTNSNTGEKVESGQYSLKVTASTTDDQNKEVPIYADVFVHGTIEELRLIGTEPVFKVGGHEVTQAGIVRLISSGLGVTDAAPADTANTETDPVEDLVNEDPANN